MKTLFDDHTTTEIIHRIDLLQENSTAQWGKMNAGQMVARCSKWDDMIFGKMQVKRILFGKLFGKMILNKVMKDEKPLRKNTPTVPDFIIRENIANFASEKLEWIKKIEAYKNFDNPNFIHPFFGKMTKNQIGIMAYKHLDHHLRQFGV